MEGSEPQAESMSDDDEADEDEDGSGEEEELTHLDPLPKSDMPLSLHVTRVDCRDRFK